MRQRILPKIPLAWYFEGSQFQLEQKYDRALVCMEKARDGFHEIGETKNEIDAWYQIGNIKIFCYLPKDAMAAYQKASSLAASIHYDRKLMGILREQRKLSEQLGDSKQTLAIEQRMDSLATISNDNQVRFVYYNNLGDIAKEQGNYKLSEKWYRKNSAYISLLGNDYKGADKYLYYSNLRNLFVKTENFDEALRYAILSKDEFQGNTEVSDKNYYMPYMSIADIYRLKGDSIRCFQCLDTLFLSMPRLDEPREIEYLFILRARCLSSFRKYDEALADYRKADDILATKYEETDGDRIRLLPLMGGIEHKLNHHEETERLYKIYAENIKQLYGDNHAEYIDALGYLANAEGFAGHIESACNDYVIAVNKLKRQIQDRLPYLTTAEREGYWSLVSQLLQNMTPFALEAKEYQTAFTSACYDGLVLSKAFLLETERSTFDMIKNKGTDENLRDFTMIAAMQLKIREWEKEGSSRTDSILELTSKVRQLEEKLSDHCRSYGDMTTFMNIGYKEIKEKLNDNDVLIDFTDYVSETRGRVYAAYLVDNKQENPLLQKLFTESKIDSMQVAYPDQYYESPYAESLYQLLWMPFKDKVTVGATVYYVPSQLLFQFALESLPMEDGTLLGEHYHFVRLSSARELVNIDKKLDIDMALANTNAVLYGGLLYDLEANDWEVEAKKYDVSSLLAFRGDILQGDSIPLLPGSKKEVDAIEKIMKSHQLKVESYTGKRGTEESFLNMSGKSPQILHVATHGFFYTPDEAKKIDYLRGYEDAMSLTGLIMSGANVAWRGKELPQGVLGGILTASNIARLDLSNTELTVLSACQSGKGQATPEGLYGLQRAFKKAGVKTMIMSLWNVSDVVGSEFMNQFYENLLDKDNHFDKRKAFEMAKSTIRDKYPEPFYWACFVMLD
ncbi:CHAT domain-containing protein [Prevotella sp. E9-3]|uniref:CHAT domain-containing protein n=1 Tax=Prevotella sp. E9-3 TaxID=2913621 RepID=UPI001EDC09CC|nr:CHAT domain-containing protein [Prevotella sp. E9-3]UKK47306.1 CHAT domain-containing protein [Prevotella sp. E9-3]